MYVHRRPKWETSSLHLFLSLLFTLKPRFLPLCGLQKPTCFLELLWLFSTLIFRTALLTAYTGEEGSRGELNLVRPRLHVHYFRLTEEQATVYLQLVCI